MKDQKKNEKNQIQKKQKYEKPSLTSENLMTFGALCNGMSTGGRKAASGAPDFCQASKLLS